MEHTRADIPLTLGPPGSEEEFVLSALKCVYWTSERTLLVADLHLGYASTYQAHGIALPTAQIDGELRRVTACVERFDPTRVIVLGDLLHARAGLNESLDDAFVAWRHSFAGTVQVVTGNHDRGIEALAPRWRLELLGGGHRERGFCFKHYPEPEPGHFVWCGHEHPATPVGSRADGLRLPCFALTGALGILPAFSSLAAGSTRGIPDGATLYAVGPEVVFAVPGRLRKGP